jgi:hypothetical protein
MKIISKNEKQNSKYLQFHIILIDMLFFKRIYKTLIGFVTCTVIVVVVMLLLWPTFDTTGFAALNDLNTEMVTDYGAGGHFWIILMMLLNVSIFLKIGIPVAGITEAVEEMSGTGAFILILAIWFLGSFAGGLASRGGLRSGLWSAVLSYLFLSFLFATMSASMAVSATGGFLIFIINFFAPMVLGSFLVIPILGIAGGITGGILGKMLFTKSKSKKKDVDSSDADSTDVDSSDKGEIEE